MNLTDKVILLVTWMLCLLLPFADPVYAGCSDSEFLQAERIHQEALQETALDKRVILLEKAFAICPSHGNYAPDYFLIGKFYYDTGQRDKAIEWLLEANRFRSALLERSAKDLADVNCHLGRLYQANGDPENALMHFNICRALRSYPDEKLERELIESAPALSALVYTQATVKKALSPTDELSDEYRGKVNRIEVYFGSDSAGLGPKITESLDAVGNALRSDDLKECLIVIEGHTDSTGDPSYNCELGARRAQAVASYLHEKCGIKREYLRAVSYGQSKPAVERRGHSREQWPALDKLNRRVVIRSWGHVSANCPGTEMLKELPACR
jgi:outer membrane protein OmpA-like peptidoglycan-associated protein